MLDPQGCILSWNPGARHMHGYSAVEVIGQSVELVYPSSLRELDSNNFSVEQTLEHARRQGKCEEEAWRVRKDGTRFWANVVTTAIYDDAGKLAGYGQVTRDLTERRQHLEALRQSEESLRLLMGSVKDYAIYMLTPEGIIHSWNHGAQLIKGYTAREVIGQHYRMFFRAEDIAAGLPERELQKALKHGRVEEEGWRLRKDGSAFWGNIIMTPIESEGRLIGFAKVTRDMSERQRLRDLEHSSKRMNEFLSMLAHELRNPLAPIRNAV
ncbi:MAG: PAS domain S-box protein, partial [Comamonas sp.]